MCGIPKRSQSISVPFAGVAAGAAVAKAKVATRSASVARFRLSVFISAVYAVVYPIRKRQVLDDGSPEVIPRRHTLSQSSFRVRTGVRCAEDLCGMRLAARADRTRRTA